VTNQLMMMMMMNQL